MGTWGLGPFDNDSAGDLVSTLVRKRGDGGWRLLTQTVAFADPAGGWAIEELVAAGEVVNWIRGHGKYPADDPKFEAWAMKQGTCVPAGVVSSLEKKLKEAATSQAFLSGFVTASQRRTWQKHVLDIVRRLRLR